METAEQEYIALCKRLIEEKFHFGNGHGELRQRDLEYLADIIEEKSGIKLSLSTLKRLWKKDYDKMPHPSTLQALVSLLGYKDWQEFKLRQMPQPATTQPITERRQKLRFNKWFLAPAAIPLAVLFWLIAFRSGPGGNKPVVKGDVTFTGNKTVSQGVPNTIIFNYDVSKVKADSFFFQQSWNETEKVKLDPKGNVYSAIYYYPGFHRAKLVANDSIIKRFRVHITTDGWFPMVRYDWFDTHPIYLKMKDAAGDSILHFSRKELAASDVNVDKDFMLSYFNVRDFDAHSDNFTLDTRVKCDDLNVACQGMQLMIMTEEHVYYVRLMGKGCERNIAIKMGEVYHDGGNHDLSALGRDMHQWQDLQIKVAGKKAVISLDRKPVYTISYKQDFGKIVGLNYNFGGTGAVDYVRLFNGDNELVYSDDFN